ncbi:hypothetical protein AWM68_14515 [Fictibacillus phosphorivorans]|uniref:ECF transporter S component n=1 Tax=Fictibacillus phosphorivorans TaxID=1221500 RepID=A0A163PY34_9BACL|nr:ECF transporter S component [Fictibacillus phosphorivorans]KZE64298.1 hypothetical protein AWM68_14515 [Fictibacillus phosphorivorans]
MNKKYVMFIVFLSLSAAGSFLKIPSPVGSVAFDSMPALSGAALISPVFGVGVASLGHLISAYLAGFPLGPLHIIIAVLMGGFVFLFGLLYRLNRKKTAIFTFIAGNGFFAPLFFYPFLGKAVVLALLPSLLVATILNVIAAIIIIPRVRPSMQKSLIRIKP